MGDEQSASATQHKDTTYTVGEAIIHVEGDTGRPEVFLETSPKKLGPATDVSLIRDSDAVELYKQLGEYLRGEGYDV
jgi:hypothetical protein